MKIEALEMIKHHPHYLSKGDQVTVPDESGQEMVNNGWAKNLDTGEVGERSTGHVSLDVQNGSNKTTAQVK